MREQLYQANLHLQQAARLRMRWKVIIGNHMKKLFVLVMALTISAPSYSIAQTTSNVLRGFQEFDLLIEELSKDANKCGVTEKRIRNAIMYPLSGAKLSIVESRIGIPSIYVVVTTVASAYTCSSSYRVSAHYYPKVKHPTYPDGVIARVNLWTRAGIDLNDISRHSLLLYGALEKFSKSFITDWNLDNK